MQINDHNPCFVEHISFNQLLHIYTQEQQEQEQQQQQQTTTTMQPKFQNLGFAMDL